MCGIAGIVAFGDAAPPTQATLRAMCGTLVHRGPDDEGVDVRESVGLGMRRLSIIDLAGGRQPLFNEDRTVRVVFNGEIYNFRELRATLASRNHRFTTSSDGEVIVHAWEEYGADFLTHLNGMFAIALHDSRRRRVLLARDRLGVKPLYFAASPGHLVFGSEIKAVLASGLVERKLDVDALGQFIAWEYVPAPQTLLRAVRKLEAGSFVDVALDSPMVSPRMWWDIPDFSTNGFNGSSPRTPDEWEDAVDAKLRQAVRRQLVSDVPLGAFLSGGVDSSLMVAHMGPAGTFSIGFDDPSYNELTWARRAAAALSVSHRQEIIRPDVLALFDRLMHYLDDPIGDFSIFPTYLVSCLARKDVTVVLSGDGGDELFGGYETYLAQRAARRWRRIPAPMRRRVLEPAVLACRPRRAKKGAVNKARRFVEGLAHDEGLGHARWRLFAGETVRQRLIAPELRPKLSSPVESHVRTLFERAGGRSEVDRGLYVDVKSYLAENILTKVDRMSMACSLEARVPYLDHELVELAFRMPDDLKLAGGSTKAALKRIATRYIPRECVYREKQGFSIPIKNWLRAEFRPLMEELLAPARTREGGVFASEAVEQLKSAHLAETADHSHVLWSLMIVEDWRRRWAVSV